MAGAVAEAATVPPPPDPDAREAGGCRAPARGSTLGGVRGVLFDYGLTLVHFEVPGAAIGAAQSEVARCLVRAGHAAPPVEVLRTAVHDRVDREIAEHERSGALEEIDVVALERRAFADLGLDLDDQLRARCSRIVQQAWFAGVRLYADTVPSLLELRARGLRVGVCSNAPYRPASMREQLAHVGVDTLLHAAVFSAEVGWRKPSPRIFEVALEALGTDASETVHVGDRMREDVDGAHSAGMRAVLIRRAERGAGDDSGAGPPEAVVASLTQLAALLAPPGQGDQVNRE